MTGSPSDFLLDLTITTLAFVVFTVLPCAGIGYLIYHLLGLPLRRQERVEFLLDMLELDGTQGIDFSRSVLPGVLNGETGFRERFRAKAERDTKNHPQHRGLAELPKSLPPQVLATLEAGVLMGDVRRVIPACRQWLNDRKSQVLAATNYVFPLLLFHAPPGFAVYLFLAIVILPKFGAIFEEMLGDAVLPPLTEWIFEHRILIAFVQLLVFMSMWVLILVYWCGPFVSAVLGSWTGRLVWAISWRRKRLQRDFSFLLALLLDAGIPESNAVEVAARGTANPVIESRARRVVSDLQQGVPLTHAVRHMDDSGSFHWRMRNAAHGRAGFTTALAGWHESLDAHAYQEEQATAHVVSTIMVLINGLVVGIVVLSLFLPLIEITKQGSMW